MIGDCGGVMARWLWCWYYGSGGGGKGIIFVLVEIVCSFLECMVVMIVVVSCRCWW